MYLGMLIELMIVCGSTMEKLPADCNGEVDHVQYW